MLGFYPSAEHGLGSTGAGFPHLSHCRLILTPITYRLGKSQ